MNRKLLHALFLIGMQVPCFGADLQFFGDLYLPAHVLQQTGTTTENPLIFRNLRHLLDSSSHNVINFEGVATNYLGGMQPKQYRLKMPLSVGPILRRVGVTAATLANNHSMDFGYPGLVDTLQVLKDSGISTTGAGRDAMHAARPLLLVVDHLRVCLMAYSRALPENFWATSATPGTAHPAISSLVNEVHRCASLANFTVVSFHWGSEMTKSVAQYQRELAHVVIRAGADAVIGHHPHVLQQIEVIDGKPIFYSIGNFAFGTRPANKHPEGIAVRITLPRAVVERPIYELVPLKVNNWDVKFQPQLLSPQDSDPLVATLGADRRFCRRLVTPAKWRCLFQ